MMLPRNFFIAPEQIETQLNEVIDKEEGIWVAGSYVSFLAMPDKLTYNDIDLFFEDKSIGELMDRRLQRSKVFKEKWRCPKGDLVTFTNATETKKVQLIKKRYYESPEEVISTFDFNACCGALDPIKNEVEFTREFIDDLSNMNLSINKITYPIASMRRLIKYSNKGFTIRPETYQHLVMEIKRLELTEENMTFYVD